MQIQQSRCIVAPAQSSQTFPEQSTLDVTPLYIAVATLHIIVLLQTKRSLMAGRFALRGSTLQGRPSIYTLRSSSNFAASRRFSLDANELRHSCSISRHAEAPAAERTVKAQAASGIGAGPSTREEAPQQTIDLKAKAAASGLPRVLIAGGGIGGLVAAVALIKRGYPVQVFERDLTAIRGEGKYRGPIQAS